MAAETGKKLSARRNRLQTTVAQTALFNLRRDSAMNRKAVISRLQRSSIGKRKEPTVRALGLISRRAARLRESA
jgi:hypothetical protein